MGGVQIRDERFAVFNGVTERVIGACIEVHRELGPGLLESVYEHCVGFELEAAGLRFERQRRVAIHYKGIPLEQQYRLDFVIEDAVVLELKCVQSLTPVHAAQTVSYLRLANLPVALLVNFYSPSIREGLRRFINKHL